MRLTNDVRDNIISDVMKETTFHVEIEKLKLMN